MFQKKGRYTMEVKITNPASGKSKNAPMKLAMAIEAVVGTDGRDSGAVRNNLEEVETVANLYPPETIVEVIGGFKDSRRYLTTCGEIAAYCKAIKPAVTALGKIKTFSYESLREDAPKTSGKTVKEIAASLMADLA
jgi:hypothetical protein